MIIRTYTEAERLFQQARKPATPAFLFDLRILRDNCRAYILEFGQGNVYFSVKANSDPRVIEILHQEGINFDIASWGEAELLMRLGVNPERIIFSAPTKIPEHIAKAFQAGIRILAFDSLIELQKLSQLAPGAKVVARLIVKNAGAEWPLEKKFGIAADEAVDLMTSAKKLGLIPYGLTFHVGSQNSLPDAWRDALELAGRTAMELRRRGMRIQFVNAGGGFPAQYTKEIPRLAEIAWAINSAAKTHLPKGIRLVVEPGRGLTANAGILAARVINRTIRNGENWLYVDAGIFHGLYEAHEGIRFPIVTARDKDARSEFIVAGPSCDSVDIIMENVALPSTLEYGDVIYFLTAGAYTNSMERYNGIDYPEMAFVG